MVKTRVALGALDFPVHSPQNSAAPSEAQTNPVTAR